MNDSNPVSVVLVAVGGYGLTYVNALLDQAQPLRARVVGVVDPFADGCKRIAEIRQRGIPIHADLESFYAGQQAELAVISSPIHLHSPQTCAALEQGSHVLCDKPAAATIQDVRRMEAARERAGRFVAIGYQWSFSEAVQALKADILEGRFGVPQRLRTLVLWPRNEAYYQRNNWAGALRNAAGDWILDSPVNNATAHYLHNMFYVLGSAPGRSALPVRLTAELYRANPISNYDTGVVRAWTETGVEVLFYSTHTTEQQRGPEFVYEFSRGTVRYDARSKQIVAEFADGSGRAYGSPDADTPRKLWDCVAAVRGGGPIACDIEAAAAQTLCMNGMQDSAPGIAGFPADLVSRQGDAGARVTVVRDLDGVLIRAYEEGRLPAEMGVPWAVAGRALEVRGYERFPRS
jgi:predicted dehydrogenase